MAFLARMHGGPRDGEQVPLDVIAPTIAFSRVTLADSWQDFYELTDTPGWLTYRFVESSVKLHRHPPVERDWSDEGYDEIDRLIDEDPIELGRLYRAALAEIAQLKGER